MRFEEPIPALPQAQLPLLAVADLQDSLMVASNDLDRLQRLLTDATETLMGHFCGASAEIGGLAGVTGGPADHHGKRYADPDWASDGCKLEGAVQRLLGSVRQL